AVVEGTDRLVDWGLKSIRGNNDEATLIAVTGLVKLYAPHVVVLEDCTDGSARRGRRARMLIRRIRRLAIGEQLRTEHISVSAVRVTFAAAGAQTKYEIAGAIT